MKLSKLDQFKLDSLSEFLDQKGEVYEETRKLLAELPVKTYFLMMYYIIKSNGNDSLSYVKSYCNNNIPSTFISRYHTYYNNRKVFNKQKLGEL